MISIIIPLYNKEKSIERTINSVRNQTYKDWELLVVNDGSEDQGPCIVKKLSLSDKRIRLINQNNQGVSVARNRGVAEAKSNNIAFLDGDDEWLSIYLDSIANIILKYPDYGMICTAGLVTSNNNIYTRIALNLKNNVIPINYFRNPHVFTHTSATVVHKDVFYKSGGFPEGMHMNQDLACFYSIALQSQVIYNGKLLTVYHGDIEGQTTARIKRHEERRKYIIERFNHCFSQWVKTGKKNREFIKFIKYEIRCYLLIAIKNKQLDTIKYYSESLNPELKKEFNPGEFFIYINNRIVSYLYIYTTKIIRKISIIAK